jgi:hypothetical protein
VNSGDVSASNPLPAASVGDVAHDSADSGNPVKVGAKAIAVGAAPTSVAAGDRTQLYANRHGVLFVQSGDPATVTIRTNITTTQTNAALVSQAAGGKIVVTEVSVACANTNTEDVTVRIGFGASTTPTGAGVVFSHPGMAAGFYCPRGTGAGILGIGADDEDLRITTSTISGTVDMDVVVSYYTLPS